MVPATWQVEVLVAKAEMEVQMQALFAFKGQTGHPQLILKILVCIASSVNTGGVASHLGRSDVSDASSAGALNNCNSRKFIEVKPTHTKVPIWQSSATVQVPPAATWK